jgi:hypothetical protein
LPRPTIDTAAAFALAAALVFGCNFRGTSPDGPPRHRFEEGLRLVYRVDYRSEGEADLRQLLGKGTGPDGTQAFRGTFGGALSLTVVERRDDGWLLAARVDDGAATFSSNGVEDPAQAEGIRQGLARGVFAQLAADGRVLSVRLPPETSPLGDRFAQTLLAAVQIVLPGGQHAAGRPWEVEEEDASGRCMVRYAPVEAFPSNPGARPGAAVLVLTRTRLRCQPAAREPRVGQTALAQEIVPSGSLAVRFDVREGRLLSIEGDETRETRLGGRKVASARTALHLQLLRRETASAAERTVLRDRFTALGVGGIDAALSTDLGEEESRRNIERNVLGEATAESLMVELHALDERGERDDAFTRRLEALFRLEPGAPRTFGAFLSGRRSEAPGFQMVWTALAAAGSREAQEVMVTHLRARRGDARAIGPLLNAVAFVARPSPPLVEFVREAALGSVAADPPASAALLVLGALARNLALDRPGEAKEVVDALSLELSRTTSVPRQQRLLLALGNAGSVEAVPALRRFLGSSSPGLRAAATNGLRWVDGDEAEALLLRALATDTDADVRLKAAAALGFREPTRPSTDAQMAALAKEDAPVVRLELLRDLSRAARRFPDALRAVQRTADRDPSQELRAAARGVLQLFPKESGGPTAVP